MDLGLPRASQTKHSGPQEYDTWVFVMTYPSLYNVLSVSNSPTITFLNGAIRTNLCPNSEVISREMGHLFLSAGLADSGKRGDEFALPFTILSVNEEEPVPRVCFHTDDKTFVFMPRKHLCLLVSKPLAAPGWNINPFMLSFLINFTLQFLQYHSPLHVP